MKLVKGVLAVTAATAMISSSASAQEVEATQATGLKLLAPDAYSSVELRHEVDRFMDGDKVANDKPNMSIRPSIGTTLFGGVVDTSANWVFQKVPGNTSIDRAAVYNVTTIDLVSGDLGFVKTYTETYFTENAFTTSYIGGYASLKQTVDVGIGSLKLSANTITVGEFKGTSESETTTAPVKVLEGVDRDTAFGLTQGGSTEEDRVIKQTTPTINSWNWFDAKLTPNAAKKLTVGLQIELDRTWAPKYEVVGDGTDAAVEQAGYSVETGTINKFNLGYKINDKLRVSNSLRQHIGGFYAEGKNGSDKRWENRLGVTATLF